MGIFRTSVDPDELRDTMSAERLQQQETTYQASRGGYFPNAEKPVPGAPKADRLRH